MNDFVHAALIYTGLFAGILAFAAVVWYAVNLHAYRAYVARHRQCWGRFYAPDTFKQFLNYR